jgi:hypothetical protein
LDPEISPSQASCAKTAQDGALFAQERNDAEPEET